MPAAWKNATDLAGDGSAGVDALALLDGRLLQGVGIAQQVGPFDDEVWLAPRSTNSFCSIRARKPHRSIQADRELSPNFGDGLRVRRRLGPEARQNCR